MADLTAATDAALAAERSAAADVLAVVDSLTVERDHLLARVAELEAAMVPATPAGWSTFYRTDFRDPAEMAKWQKRSETQANDNSYNQAGNAVVTPGGLEVWMRREASHNRPYTTADLLGKHITLPNYFRLQVTGTAPTIPGTWPCLLWLRPANSDVGEIDVMESWPTAWQSPSAAEMKVTLHNAYGAGHKMLGQTFRYSMLPASDPAAAHTYTVEKTPGQMSFWVDGVLVKTFKRADATWWDSVFEVTGRTWYPRITMQAGGSGAGGEVPAGVDSAKLTVSDLWALVPTGEPTTTEARA